jgi:Divergent InlB B-repeat domain
MPGVRLFYDLRRDQVSFAQQLRHIGVAVTVVALVGVTGASARPQDERMLRVVSIGGGVVASDNERILCGSRCSAAYKRGTLVGLRASPGSNWTFERWSGDCVGTASRCIVALDRRTAVRAVFRRKIGLVRVVVGGPGTIISNPAGLACGRNGEMCAGRFERGMTIKLTATPAREGAFETWSGACAGRARDCELVVSDVSEVSAVFRHAVPAPGRQRLIVRLERRPPLSSVPPGINCPPTCEAMFPTGTLATLRGGGSYIWGGACVGFGPACALVIDASANVLAAELLPSIPGPSRVGVNVSVSGRGVVLGGRIRCGGARGTLLDCESFFAPGTSVDLQAIPPRGSRFARWGGFCRGMKPRCRLLVNAPKTVQALFRRR